MGSDGHHAGELEKLPRELCWEAIDVYKLQGFWYYPMVLDTIMAMKDHFKAREDDVVLTSSMKTGTTWLKALCHCIMFSHKSSHSADLQDHDEEEDLLLKYHPHECVPSLESKVYGDNLQPDLSGMPSPRLFHTHLPYSFLPDSIKNSDCKIVYIARNPKDTFVSMWHHNNKIFRPNMPPYPIEQALESFCRGVHFYGPFHEHVLEYRNESMEKPKKILFLKYEELKRDPKGQVKRLASFLGRPFDSEDKIDKVLWRCSFERLKNLEVNKFGEPVYPYVPNSSFFRLGVVGDWMNYLTPEMGQRLDRLTETKFEGTGLDL